MKRLEHVKPGWILNLEIYFQFIPELHTKHVYSRLTRLNLIIHQGCQMIVVNYKFGTKRGRSRNLLELYSIPSPLIFSTTTILVKLI